MSFACSFQNACSHNSQERHEQLKKEFSQAMSASVDNGLRPTINVCDVMYHIDKLKSGKAPGLDSITAEHLWFAHPIVAVLLAILFNACIKLCYVPMGFAEGVVIPLLKGGALDNTSTDSYRRITLCSVLSKIFEMLLFDFIRDRITSSDLQFGFKKILDVVMLFLQADWL